MSIYSAVSVFSANHIFRQPQEQTHKLQRRQAFAVTQQIKTEESRLFTSSSEGKSLDATYRAFLFNDQPEETSVVE